VLGEKQVESEREVVANERRFRVEDDVDGFLNEELFKLAFQTHPYHWPTIGWMQDIMGISIADCRAFYRTYYSPNNATLVVAGDVDEREVLELVQTGYGRIPAQQLPPDASTPEPVQTAERRATWKKPVTADKLRLGYKSPPLGHPDYLALEVLSEILFGGKSSRLEKMLVQDLEIASSTSAALSPFKDPGLYEIAISMQRGHAAAEAETRVSDELAQVQREALRPGELDTAKTRLLTRLWRELRTLGGRAEALGHYHTTIGDFRQVFQVADQVRACTEADLQRVAREYLRPERRTVVIAEPNGEEDGE
jgi:zinc protease